MRLSAQKEIIPLETDRDGVIRVGGTRVTLDSVLHSFSRGATAEEIQKHYTSLRLADIYYVIGYYLSNQEDLDAYLTERSREEDVIRRRNDMKFGHSGVRERLLTRASS